MSQVRSEWQNSHLGSVPELCQIGSVCMNMWSCTDEVGVIMYISGTGGLEAGGCVSIARCNLNSRGLQKLWKLAIGLSHC